MNHVAGRTLSFAEEELLARMRIAGGLGIESGHIERTQPSGQRLKLALRQLERGHAARGSALNQVTDLLFVPGAQTAVVHQCWRPVSAVSTLTVASFAEAVELASCRGEIGSRRGRRLRHSLRCYQYSGDQCAGNIRRHRLFGSTFTSSQTGLICLPLHPPVCGEGILPKEFFDSFRTLLPEVFMDQAQRLAKRAHGFAIGPVARE